MRFLLCEETRTTQSLVELNSRPRALHLKSVKGGERMRKIHTDGRLERIVKR